MKNKMLYLFLMLLVLIIIVLILILNSIKTKEEDKENLENIDVEEIYTMQVFLNKDLTEPQILEIEEEIKNIKINQVIAISKIERISKQEAYEVVKEKYKDHPEVFESININNFKESFVIELQQGKYIDNLEKKIENINGVERILKAY